MRFREYGEVKPVTLAARTPRGLDRQIEALGGKCDIIDLQFASRTLACGEPEYSALALVRAAGREARGGENQRHAKGEPTMFYVEKRMEIAGAHRLALPYESKCQNLHGHNWVVVVRCKAEELDEAGMVADFTHIKKAIHDKLDHRNLNDILPFNPTAENMAKWICEQIPNCYQVAVQESEGNVAIYDKE